MATPLQFESNFALCKMCGDDSSWRTIADEATALERANQMEQALRKWEQVRALHDSPAAAVKYGYAALGLGLLEAARKAALEGLALDAAMGKGIKSILYCLAGTTELDLYSLDGQKSHLENARTYFSEAVKVHENPDYYVFLGTVFMGLKDRSSAEACLRKALVLEPSNEEAMYNLAEVIRCSREGPAPAEAVELYRKAMAIDPRYAPSHHGLARVLLAAGQSEEAERHARLAVKFDRSNWAAHMTLGQVLRRGGQIAAAKKELERAAEMAPLEWEAQSALASFYDKHGSLKNAQQAYRRCLDIDPGNAWANRRYGAVLACLDKFVESRVFLKKAMALDPDDRRAPHYLQELETFQAHRRPKAHVHTRRRMR